MGLSQGRLANPGVFYDRASQKLLLPPTKDYTLARMLYAADARAQLMLAGAQIGIALPERGTVLSAGTPLEDAQYLIGSTIPSEAIEVKLDLLGKTNALGMPQAHTINFNRPVLLAGTNTQAARRINPAVDIATTSLDQQSEQVSVTIEPYAGPHNGTSSGPLSMNAFDAALGEEQLADRIGLEFSHDRMAFIDGVLTTLYGSASTIVYAGDVNGTYSATTDADSAFAVLGDRRMSLVTILLLEQSMTANNIRPFSDGYWILVISARQKFQLLTDPDYLEQSKGEVNNGYNPLSNNYVGTVSKTRVYVSNSVATASNGSSITYQKGFAFGPQALAYAPCLPPHVRSSTADNYGLAPEVDVVLPSEGLGVLDVQRLRGVWSD